MPDKKHVLSQNEKRKVNQAYEKTKILAEKTSACYNQIEEFVQNVKQYII